MVEQGGQSFRPQGQADADNDLAEPQPDAQHRHDQGHRRTSGHPVEEPDPERSGLVGAEEAGIGAGQHHPFDADIQHAGLLGNLLAQVRPAAGARPI